MDHAAKFQKLEFRAPGSLSDAIDAAAGKHLQSKSEYIRRSVIDRLRADGFDPATIAPRDAGSLYDTVAGQRCYALVDGDRIASISYHEAKPDDGRNWLPVYHEDSEPFDISAHWRLPPIDRVEPDRVVREFPVVPKSLEAM